MELNFYPLHFNFEEYQITETEYSDEKLRDLRKAYNTTHSFFRSGGKIYISNYNSDKNIELGQTQTVSLFGQKEITLSLIKHIFFRTFKGRFVNYLPADFYPFRFYSAKDNNDIISHLLPEHLKGRLSYNKLIEVQLRHISIVGQEQFGFVVNIKRNWIFDKNCNTLHLEGFDLIGREVLHAEELPGLKKILAPNEELVGTVLRVENNCALIKTNDGDVEYNLNELFIRKNRDNIYDYLSFAIDEQRAAKIFNEIENKRSEVFNTKNIYNEINDIALKLFYNLGSNSPVDFCNLDGFSFTVSTKPMKISNTFFVKNPTFIFYPAATRTNNVSPDLGLTNFGPYDGVIFAPKSPNVFCICHRENRGAFADFLASLKDGIPHSNYYKKGLQKKYELQDIVYNIHQITEFTLSEYLNVIRDWNEVKPDLVIIEIPSLFKKILDSKNPYYQIKAKLLGLEIPVQYVSTENIRGYNEYILNSIALQCYAKLGGTPWVLPSQRSVDREIIIGIGHSWLRTNQFRGADSFRIVGITTFLSSDGQYLLSDKVKEVQLEDYFEELLKSLTSSFNRLEKEQGWNEGDTVRLIFHIFKPIKNTEFDVISKFIENNSKYIISFAFVTIGSSPYLMFEPNQPGVYGKGEFIPNRGSNIFLDSETCIIQMVGPKELKTSKQPMSPPIQIKIRKPQNDSNNKELNDKIFHDLTYIVQQIYSFTYLSWRSFLPSDKPATMLYANLISKMLGKLRNVPGWDPDRLNYSLKTKKWFL